MTIAASGVVSVILALLTGCGGLVAGSPLAADQTAVQRRIPGDLAALLPDPGQFPARYPAVRLPPEAAAQAAGDLTGVPRGARVTPASCTPPAAAPGPENTAVAVGTDNETRATLTVELTRTTRPLSELRAQLLGCGEMQVSGAGPTTTVRTTLVDPPDVDADDTLALRHTVRPDVGGVGLVQTMRTVAAQIADVRITVTYMIFAEVTEIPDSAAQDELFAVAVREVREA
ncbi:DUF5642 family protein [Nocardia takedensis]|uniref:DUF5642 family protein n=1 Tax=Nocardia takedensis TaxID=259390 RepID=UPI0003002CC3|nr:DUF5642 family protein [Nocardia takedensis]